MVHESHELKRFGELAVELGFVSALDVEKALRIQRFRRERDQPVPWLGEILESLGLLSAAQTQHVFATLFELANRRPSVDVTPVAAPQPAPTRWWPFRTAG